MAHVSSLTPPRGLARRWLLALRNVGIGALLLAATLLVLGFLTLTSAHAQAKPELRIVSFGLAIDQVLDFLLAPGQTSSVLDRRVVYLSWVESGPNDTRGAAVGRSLRDGGFDDSSTVEV